MSQFSHHDERHESANTLSHIHLVRHTMHEDVFYPPHAPRTESEEYRAIHHQMLVVEDRPCFICGVRNSTLADPAHNPKGAKELELHHLWVEWALADAVDAEKLSRWVGLPITADQLADWVDHHRRNLLPLCDVDHRHKEHGIHELSFPIWIAQKFVRSDYSLVREGNHT